MKVFLNDIINYNKYVDTYIRLIPCLGTPFALGKEYLVWSDLYKTPTKPPAIPSGEKAPLIIKLKACGTSPICQKIITRAETT